MTQTELRSVGAAPCNASVPGANPGFSIVAGDSAERATIEARIRSGFGAHFGACIAGFMPSFACYRDDQGNVVGIIGLRNAGEGRLFLEDYLADPVEAVIGKAADRPVRRQDVVEVGQFVIDDRDLAPAFFRDLVPFLQSLGFQWVCFTGTGRIRAILSRLGFHGRTIAVAKPDQISGGDDWGSYYEHDPEVVAGKLDDAAGRWCREPGIIRFPAPGYR